MVLSVSGAFRLGCRFAGRRLVAQLAVEHEVRAIFLGCAQMTLDRFDRFPGRSHGYANLPEPTRRQFVADVPRWSEFVRQETKRFGYPYLDTSENFAARLLEAEAVLTERGTPSQSQHLPATSAYSLPAADPSALP